MSAGYGSVCLGGHKITLYVIQHLVGSLYAPVFQPFAVFNILSRRAHLLTNCQKIFTDKLSKEEPSGCLLTVANLNRFTQSQWFLNLLSNQGLDADQTSHFIQDGKPQTIIKTSNRLVKQSKQLVLGVQRVKYFSIGGIRFYIDSDENVNFITGMFYHI